MSNRLIVVLCLVALGAGGCGGRAADGIVGKWQATADGETVTLEFAKDGKLSLIGNPAPLAFAFPFAKVMNDFRVAPAGVPLTYKLTGASQLEISADLSKLLAGLAGDPTTVVEGGVVRESADITVGQEELTIKKDAKSVTFKRVK